MSTDLEALLPREVTSDALDALADVLTRLHDGVSKTTPTIVSLPLAGQEDDFEKGRENELAFAREVYSWVQRIMSYLLRRQESITALKGDHAFDSLLHGANRLLVALFNNGGDSSSPTEYRISQPPDGEVVLKLVLRELPQTNGNLASSDAGPTGWRTWGCALELASALIVDPNEFITGSSFPKGFRVLELGCGTGLVGLTAAAVLGRCEAVGDNIHVVLSDHDDEILDNARANIVLSREALPLDVDCQMLDWSEPHENNSGREDTYQLILAADVVFEPAHPDLLLNVVSHLLAYPSAGSTPAFFAMLALRETHTADIEAFEACFSEGHGFTIESKRLSTGATGFSGRGSTGEYCLYKIVREE